MYLLFLACQQAKPDPIRQGQPSQDSSDSSLDSHHDSSPQGPCPSEMALAGDTCVDRWEATLLDWSPYDVPDDRVFSGDLPAQSIVGVPPQGYLSGEMAEAACAAAGKRLCSLGEWMRACQGPEGWTYPYGNDYDASACNTSCAQHPVVSYWGNDPDMWDSEHMNAPGINQQPDTLDATGANPACVSAEGIFDLHGNLHEWIQDADGTFKGGFYADASINGAGCLYTTSAHDVSYHDYSTGFRCCKEPTL